MANKKSKYQEKHRSVHIKKEVHSALLKHCEKNGMSMRFILNLIIKDYIKEVNNG